MPTKRKTAAKSKKSPDPPARLSPAPTPVSSPDVSDDESIPGHADRNPSAPVLTKEGQTNLTSKEQAEKQTDSQPSSKKKRKPNLMLSEQQEDDVADWIQEHPLFYSKGVKEYNDTAKKQRLWNMKAREHNLESSALLLTW